MEPQDLEQLENIPIELPEESTGTFYAATIGSYSDADMTFESAAFGQSKAIRYMGFGLNMVPQMFIWERIK